MSKKKDLEISKCCAYCEKAIYTNDEEIMLCSKRGEVEAGFCCRLFTYDLLKRTPKTQRAPIALDPSLLQF